MFSMTDISRAPKYVCRWTVYPSAVSCDSETISLFVSMDALGWKRNYIHMTSAIDLSEALSFLKEILSRVRETTHELPSKRPQLSPVES